MIRTHQLSLTAFGLVAVAGACSAAPLAIEVNVGDTPPAVHVPVTAPLPQTVTGPLLPPPSDGAWWAKSAGDPGFAAQICRLGPWGEGRPYLALLLPASLPMGRMEYSLDMAYVPFLRALRFEEAEEKHLHMFEGDKPALTYNFGMMLAEGVPEDRRRACYIHPLCGLDGEEISGDFERDHYHHRGLFWAWPRMKAGERSFNLWSLSGGQQRFEKWLGRESGPVCAVFGVQNGWYVGEDRVASETAWVRIWRAGEIGRAIDVHLTWEATEQPIEILGQGGKGYGGFNLRFGPRQDTVLTTDEGRQQDSNLKQFPWADLSARFAGAEHTSGAAIFVDGRNPAFPNGWTLRHYGFLGVAWPGLEPYVLEPGRPVTVRYRLWVHRGDAESGRVAEAYAAFAQPPAVTMSASAQGE